MKKVDFKNGDSSDIERALRSVVGKSVIIEEFHHISDFRSEITKGGYLILGKVRGFYNKRRSFQNTLYRLLHGPNSIKDYEFCSNDHWILEFEYKNLKELYLVNREDESGDSL